MDARMARILYGESFPFLCGDISFLGSPFIPKEFPEYFLVLRD